MLLDVSLCGVGTGDGVCVVELVATFRIYYMLTPSFQRKDLKHRDMRKLVICSELVRQSHH